MARMKSRRSASGCERHVCMSARSPDCAAGALVRTRRSGRLSRKRMWKRTPSAIDTSPGTMNTARQPPTASRPLMMIGVTAMPALPNTPLMPSSRPRLSPAPRTMSGMPTGW